MVVNQKDHYLFVEFNEVDHDFRPSPVQVQVLNSRRTKQPVFVFVNVDAVKLIRNGPTVHDVIGQVIELTA